MNKNITAFHKRDFIEAVKLANKEIYTYINENLSLNDYSYTNSVGFGGDNSLKMDLIAEKIFIKYLDKFGNIYSEECGLLTTNKDYTLVIDPLDGSNNFYSDLPYYGTSVALKYNEEIVAGFVTNLVSGIMTYRVFDEEKKYFSLITMDYKDKIKVVKTKLAIFERAYTYPKICDKLSLLHIKFRTLGAVALSLCSAIDYEFVLYGGNIREFDIAAALYICKDLYIYRSNEYLFITKNKEKYDLLKEIINQF
ncbi:MAG: inositol monophosphatase family protein [Arcobacter sp.]|uniref:inositol monophosphatase family protein n=1 Tax=unclassified Arcobacter TaxID=2593671 RepID=UPI0002296251|nr:inositol monophosphatase family protein [Arcobacter sp. L]BAK74175.1 inositol monophosphatase [Arcobacter sp. L]